MPGWESPQEKDVVDQSISNGCIAVAAGHNTLADEINRKEQDQNNYLTMLDYNFCKTVVSEWTKGRVQDQKSIEEQWIRRPREEDGRSRGLGECTSLGAPS